MTKFMHNLISVIVCCGTLLLFTVIALFHSHEIIQPIDLSLCPENYFYSPSENVCIPVQKKSMEENGITLCSDGSIVSRESGCKGVLNEALKTYACPGYIPIHIDDHDPGLGYQNVIPSMPPKYPHKRYVWCGVRVSKEEADHIKNG